MADMLKLFHEKRLTATEPEHLTFITGRLAAMKLEAVNDEQLEYYKYWAGVYGIDVEVTVTPKEVEPITEEVVEEFPVIEVKPKKKRKSKKV